MEIVKKYGVGTGMLYEADAGYILPSSHEQFLKEYKSKKNNNNSKLNIVNGLPRLYCVLQKYGIKNANGRVYPEDILKKNVQRYQKLINIGASAGEADHPDSPVISAKNIALKVEKVWWQGATLMGEISLPVSRGFLEQGIVSTKADLMANHILNGILLGVSSRGVGSVEEQNNTLFVQDDFELICWDFVTTPSTTGSWVYSDIELTKPHIEEKIEILQKNNTNNNDLSKIKDFLNNFR